MEDRNKVYADVDGELTHVGYAGSPDEGGARATELFDQFKEAELKDVQVELNDDTQVLESGTTFDVPIEFPNSNEDDNL